jgi:hypothetical protein
MRKFFALSLALFISFFGAIELSNIPQGLTAVNNVVYERTSHMTSCENGIEIDGICFETLLPEQDYLLPKYGEETPIQHIDDFKKLERPDQKSEFWRVLTSSFPDWDFSSSGYPGDLESVIDLDYNNPRQKAPYYYAAEASYNKRNPYYFTDISSRTDGDEEHDWTALLYLAEEITKPGSSRRKALIYGGVSWGWHNRIIDKQPSTPPGKPPTRERERQRRRKKPQPQYCPVSTFGCDNPPPGGGSGGGGFNKYDPNERYATIPEATPAIGVITLAAWAIVKTLKRKN